MNIINVPRNPLKSFHTVNRNAVFSAIIVFLFLFSNFDAKTAEEKKQVYRARIDDTEFAIKEKSGFLTSYRRISSDPMIDYISLCEEDKTQMGYAGLKGLYDWKDGILKPSKGKVIFEHNLPVDKKWALPHQRGDAQVILGNEEKEGISFIAQGKLLSKWTQSFNWKTEELKNEKDKILDIKWQREGDEIAPIKIAVAFPRNSQESAYILEPDKISRMNNKDSVKIAKDTKIAVPVLSQGTTLEISFDCAGSIRQRNREKIEALLGGWTLEFIPDDSEMLKDFSCRITDRAYNKVNVNGLEIAPNLDSGIYSAFCGGMPLFQICGIDGKNYQDLSGNWTGKYLKNKTTCYIQNSGKIVSDWKTFCKTDGKKLSFKFVAEGNENDKGVMIKIPYSWVGSRFQIKQKEAVSEAPGVVPPYGKSNEHTSYQNMKEVDGCPLRTGSCLNMGELTEGSVLEWFPTESEKVSFKLSQSCRIISGRDIGSSYSSPFDVTFPTCENWQEVVMAYKHKGAIEFRPDAFICIYPVKNELAVECSYENILAEEKSVQTKAATIPGIDNIQYERQGDTLTVKTPFWQITHDGTKGWVPTELVFTSGLDRNILKAPIEAYLVNSEDRTVSESDAKNCTMEVRKGDENVILTVKGLMGNIPFVTEYVYDRGGMKRTLSLDFKNAPAALKTVGVVRIETDPELNYAKYKPCSVRYVKAIFPGAPITQGNRITLGVMGLYRQNGEGVDFYSTSDLWKWYVLGENKGFFAIKGNKANPVIIAEAFHVDKAQKIDSRIEYSHYIGLPEVKNPMPRDFRAANISNPIQWSSDNVVSAYADAGINVTVSGLGLGGFGVYSDKHGQELIASAKKFRDKGIRITPFFAPSCFVKQAEEVVKNIDNWGVGGEVNGKVKPLWAGQYVMGCFESKDMCDFMKKGFPEQLKDYPNDGIYCDFIYPSGPCFNKAHGPGTPHLGMEGLLDFCAWIKKDLLKKDQIFYAHTGYCPVYHVERYCDLAWIGEEINSSFSHDGRPISLQRVSEGGVQTSNVQRVLDPHAIYSWIKPNGRVQPVPEDQHVFITRTALNGHFPLLHTGQLSPVSEEDLLKKAEPTLRLFRAFKGIALSDYHFMDWKTQNVVNTDDPYVKAAVYFKDKSILIVLGVPEDGKAHEFTWKISKDFLNSLGLNGNLELRNTLTGKNQQTASSAVSGSGIKEKLDGFNFSVTMINLAK